MPPSWKYQEWQPVFQTVGPIAPATSSLNSAVASSVTSTDRIAPSRRSSIQWAMYRAVSSAVCCSEIEPVGELGAHPNRGCRSWGLKPPVSSRLRAM